ncbi:MAG: MMPL family transporter [Proteobacteria bacterium]|nr:MMPL family transporter [Pseudomonadota bacterium]
MKKNSGVIRWAIVLLVVALCGYWANGLEIGEDALDMLPGEAVRGDLQLLQRIGLVDRVFINFEIPAATSAAGALDADIEALKKSAAGVASALSRSSHFKDVTCKLPEGYEWELFRALKTAMPALLSQDDYLEIETLLGEGKLREILNTNFLLLNSLAGLPLKQQVVSDPLGLSAMVMKHLDALRGEFDLVIRDGYFFSRDGRNCLLWAQSVEPLTNSRSAEKVQLELDAVLEQHLVPGVKARIIGSLPHTLANSRTIRADLGRLVPAAMIVLVVLILVAMRDLRGLLVVCIPFLAAPVAVASLMLIYENVSAMALGFGVVLLGIAVDFAIHIFYALSRERGSEREIISRLRKPVFLASCTTIGVFVVLLFSAVPSHRQMALLAIFGVAFAVIFSWLLIPTLVKKRGSLLAMPGDTAGVSLVAFSGGGRFFFFILWAGLIISGIIAWPHLRYNGDLKKLDVPNEQVMADEAHFISTWKQGGDQSFVVVEGKDLAEALNRNDRVHAYLFSKKIKGFQSVAPVMPGPLVRENNISLWQSFWSRNQKKLGEDLARIGPETGFTATAFEPFLRWIQEPVARLADEDILNSPMRPMLVSLLRLPEAGTAGSGTGEFLATTIVAESAESVNALQDLSRDLPEAHVLSSARWRSQVERLLRHDIVKLSSAAGVLVILLIGIFFRRPRIVLAVMAPVLSALAAMAVFDYLTTRDLNLMHVLMGIMVIGLSVDYGIFVVCACQRGMTRHAVIAVSICAASTLTGFGVLSFATHPALHALGVTVLAGIGAAWPTALFITPVIMGKNHGEKKC